MYNLHMFVPSLSISDKNGSHKLILLPAGIENCGQVCLLYILMERTLKEFSRINTLQAKEEF